jgi:hypothetical protein
MSVKQNFPTIRPTLNLDFAGSQVVDSRITFTRASAATLTDAQGILKTVRDNKPRIDFDPSTGECKGLLIEEQRTNRVNYSSEFNNSYWQIDSGGTLIPNQAISPDGSLTADLVRETASSGISPRLIKTNPWSDLSGVTFTFSVYVKSFGTKRNVFMLCQESANAFYAHFDIVAGTVVQVSNSGSGVLVGANIENEGNGWFRISITGSIPSSEIYMMTQTETVGSTGFGAPSYTGDGSSGVFYWGSQVETGSFATSYISTTLTFTSRASSATYFDSTGVLRTAPVNSARYGFGYDTTTAKWISQGLILEAAATNLLPESNNFAAGSWITGAGTKPTVTKNYLSPSGMYDASLITPAGTTFSRIGWQFTVAAATSYTFSIFLKAGGFGTQGIFTSQSAYSAGTIDLATGVCTVNSAGNYNATMRSEKFNDGWWRVFYTINNAGSAFTETIGMYWDGFTTDKTTYLYGAQMETGTSGTSYIPTYGATATRAADSSTSTATTRAAELAYLSKDNFSSWYSPMQGTAYVEYTPVYSVMPAYSFQNSAGSTSNHWTLSSTSGQYAFFSASNAIGNGSLNGTAGVTAGVFTKVAIAVQAGNGAISQNGNTAAAISGFNSMPSVDRLVLTATYNLAGTNAYIKKFSYYPKRLSNTQLQALTV